MRRLFAPLVIAASAVTFGPAEVHAAACIWDVYFVDSTSNPTTGTVGCNTGIATPATWAARNTGVANGDTVFIVGTDNDANNVPIVRGTAHPMTVYYVQQLRPLVYRTTKYPGYLYWDVNMGANGEWQFLYDPDDATTSDGIVTAPN